MATQLVSVKVYDLYVGLVFPEVPNGLFSQVMLHRYLREMWDIHISLCPASSGIGYYFTVYSMLGGSLSCRVDDETAFDSYESALDAGFVAAYSFINE